MIIYDKRLFNVQSTNNSQLIFVKSAVCNFSKGYNGCRCDSPVWNKAVLLRANYVVLMEVFFFSLLDFSKMV